MLILQLIQSVSYFTIKNETQASINHEKKESSSIFTALISR